TKPGAESHVTCRAAASATAGKASLTGLFSGRNRISNELFTLCSVNVYIRARFRRGGRAGRGERNDQGCGARGPGVGGHRIASAQWSRQRGRGGTQPRVRGRPRVALYPTCSGAKPE